MNVKNDIQSLQQIFESQQVTGAAGAKSKSAAEPAEAAGADQATLSAAASLAAHASSVSDVRTEKVAEVQQALAAGTYNVPSSAVAGKMIDHMMGK